MGEQCGGPALSRREGPPTERGRAAPPPGTCREGHCKVLTKHRLHGWRVNARSDVLQGVSTVMSAPPPPKRSGLFDHFYSDGTEIKPGCTMHAELTTPVTEQVFGPFRLWRRWASERVEKPPLRGVRCGSGRPGPVRCPSTSRTWPLLFCGRKQGHVWFTGQFRGARPCVQELLEARPPPTGQPRRAQKAAACKVGS